MTWGPSLDGSIVKVTAPALAGAVRPGRMAKPPADPASHRTLVYRAPHGEAWCAPCVLTDWTAHRFPGEALDVGSAADCARCGRGIY